ncbi:MAG: restriction endonuclease [Rhodospirillales bacterium]|nr:restriction endonuclease [Rhodospirillales bacterium]
MGDKFLSSLRKLSFQVECTSHAEAILSVDFPKALQEIEQVLQSMRIPVEELVRGGGGESKGTQRLRKAFAKLNWKKTKFELKKLINEAEKQSISHEIDHVRISDRGTIALEIEWNNKDPFFDRDLENFKRLHAEGAISVGVIITRGKTLQDKLREFIRNFALKNKILSTGDLAKFDLELTKRKRDETERRTKDGKVSFADAWASQFCGDKYGQATTHWQKLKDRITRGVGNPCPLLLIGIPDTVVTE